MFSKVGHGFSNAMGGAFKSGGGGMSVLVILTVSVEELASFIMFECPCDNTNWLYGFSYLFGPCKSIIPVQD